MRTFKQVWVAICILVVGSMVSACLDLGEATEDSETGAALATASEEDFTGELLVPDTEGEELAAAQDLDVQAQACCGSYRECAPPVCREVLRCRTWPPPFCQLETECDPPVCHDQPLSCVGPAPCSHSTCAQGDPLNPTCDPTVAAICRQDWFCCSNRWDQWCVGHVGDIAGRSCAGCN